MNKPLNIHNRTYAEGGSASLPYGGSGLPYGGSGLPYTRKKPRKDDGGVVETPAYLKPILDLASTVGTKGALAAMTMPERLKSAAQSAYGAATLPGDVVTGHVDPLSDAGVKRAVDLANMAAAGGLGAEAPSGSLRMFAGRTAKTADLAKLAEMERLEAAGVPRGDVRAQTGWHRGVDNLPRFEFSDAASVYRPEAMKPETAVIGGNRFDYRTGRLADVLEHPELFRAYPDLAEIPVSEGKFNTPFTRGQYNAGFREGDPGYIALSSDILNNSDEARSVLLHEVMHAIQEREGMARGTNPSSISPTQFKNPALEHYERMQSHPVVEEYRNVYKSPNYNRELDQSNALWNAEYQPILDQLYKERPSERGALNDDLNARIQRVFDQYKEISKDRFPTMARSDQLAEEMRGLGVPFRRPKEYLTPEEAYKRHAGEVEARNVQSRANVGDDDLRHSIYDPWRTEDVPEHQQIVRFRATGGEVSAPITGPHTITLDDLIGRAPAPASRPGAYTDTGGQSIAAPFVTGMANGYPVYSIPNGDAAISNALDIASSLSGRRKAGTPAFGEHSYV